MTAKKSDLSTQMIDKIIAKESVVGQYTVAKQKVTVIDYEEFSRLDFQPPATWFIKDASGYYIFVHTSQRAKAQAWIDEEYGKGRYTVNASRVQKKHNTGEGSKPAYGVATRRGQKR